jgi:hypothetical protein
VHGKEKETVEPNFVEDDKNRTLETEGCGTHVNVKEKASRMKCQDYLLSSEAGRRYARWIHCGANFDAGGAL